MDEYDSTYAPQSPDLSGAPIPPDPSAADVHPQHQRYRGSISHVSPLSPSAAYPPSNPFAGAQYSPPAPQHPAHSSYPPPLATPITPGPPSYYPYAPQHQHPHPPPPVHTPTTPQQNPYFHRQGSNLAWSTTTGASPYAPQQHLQPQSHPSYDMASSAGKRAPRPRIEEPEYVPDDQSSAVPSPVDSGRPMSSGAGSSMATGPVEPVAPRGDGPAMGIEVRTKFPVARIKRIMQADEDVGKVSQVVPPAVAKALELFMIALVTQSATEAKARSSKRVTAQHFKQAVLKDERFDFLTDIVSKVPDAPPPSAKGEDSEGEGKKKRSGRKRRKDSEDP